MSKIQKVLLALSTTMLLAVVTVSVVLGVKDYKLRQPRFSKGDCLVDKDAGVAIFVRGVQGKNYLLVILGPQGMVPAMIDIKNMNEERGDFLVKVNCETGEVLEN